jgi:serine/threonine protein kinase
MSRGEGSIQVELHERIGSGFTSEVHVATIAIGSFVRRAAAKVLRSEVPDRVLLHEIEILSRLDGVHAPKLLGQVTLLGRPALLMDFIDEPTLDQQGPIPLDRARLLAGDLLTVIERLRTLDIWHGDLSLRNIFWSETAGIRLIDFGHWSTETTPLVASPAFLAPERLCGQRPDWVGDLYSVGRILERLGLSLTEERLEFLVETCPKRRAEGHFRLMARNRGESTARSKRVDVEATVSLPIEPRSRVRGQTLTVRRDRPPPSKWRRARSWAVVSSISLSLFTQPGTTSPPALITIGPQTCWTALEISGVRVGYAPTQTQVPAGRVPIIWRTQSSQGQFVIDVRPAEVIHLDSLGDETGCSGSEVMPASIRRMGRGFDGQGGIAREAR